MNRHRDFRDRKPRDSITASPQQRVLLPITPTSTIPPFFFTSYKLSVAADARLPHYSFRARNTSAAYNFRHRLPTGIRRVSDHYRKSQQCGLADFGDSANACGSKKKKKKKNRRRNVDRNDGKLQGSSRIEESVSSVYFNPPILST